MSVLNEIKKLEEQKKLLIEKAKKEALDKATNALKELADLGFKYQLVQEHTTKPTMRRSGVKTNVLNVIQKNPNGINRAGLLSALDAEDDKTKASISNALAALKKAGTVTAKDGYYSVQS